MVTVQEGSFWFLAINHLAAGDPLEPPQGPLRVPVPLVEKQRERERESLRQRNNNKYCTSANNKEWELKPRHQPN